MSDNFTNINRVPFKVSARTARLIGRENIASSKGAIIELVKNGYDADSKISIVYFDNKYTTLKDVVSIDFINELIFLGVPKKDIFELYEIYEKDRNFLKLKQNVDDEKKKNCKKLIAKFNALYIIDTGEGMTQKIIRDYWMNIGTDNKANNVFTKSGRVKSGAKGIGRFALDKLGEKCEMTTIFNPEYHEKDIDEKGNKTNYSGYKWIVNWEDFEEDFKTIDKVDAALIGFNPGSIKEELKQILPSLNIDSIKSEKEFKYGTILKISNLRDNWEDYYVDDVFSDLEVLVPPKEVGEFLQFT